jgi:hypothetical protein
MVDDKQSRVRELCGELVRLLGLRKGHVEIHCHDGDPKQVHIIDKSLTFKDKQRTRQIMA